MRLQIAAALALLSPLAAQAAPQNEIVVGLDIDSGTVQNTLTSPATAGIAQVVWSTVITAPGASLIRLNYAGVMLSGAKDRGSDGSFVRITSLLDGHVQTQHRLHIGQWQDTSAYFNGNSVLVELLAHQGTGPNRLIIDKAWSNGSIQPHVDSICGSTDDRLPSTDQRVCRLMPIGCTGWMIDDCNQCLLTAGHCTTSRMQVAQFNVPLSTSGGNPVAPPPSDQYAIDRSSLQTNGGQGVGNDWGYVGVFSNSTTGLTPFQAQGQTFQLVTPPPLSGGQIIRITGHGSTTSPINPTWDLAQKTHTGAFVTNSGSTVQYTTDTTGGNSGSPVIFEATGEAVGIHTHGGCSSTGGQNQGLARTIRLFKPHWPILAAFASARRSASTTPTACRS